jgi:hypothetical protein
MYIVHPVTNIHFHTIPRMKEGVFYHVWKAASHALGKYVLSIANLL